jgi:hypothetical protein
MSQNNPEKSHDYSTKEIAKKARPPSIIVSTSTKQIMNYVTVKSIESETSYVERDWPLFCLKELLDNAYDFLNDNYSASPKEHRMIAVKARIFKQYKILRMKVLNSNINNITVFDNLKATFDFNQWYSSKRDQHRLTCGSLGDALKRILGMGYASITRIDVGDSFVDKQWNEPLILRFNGKEYKVLIRVNKARQEISSQIEGAYEWKFGNNRCIEVEIALPLLQEQGQNDDDYYYCNLADKLRNYYRIYKIAKSLLTIWMMVGSPLRISFPPKI